MSETRKTVRVESISEIIGFTLLEVAGHLESVTFLDPIGDKKFHDAVRAIGRRGVELMELEGETK